MGNYGTARPPTERDTLHSLNGSPYFLGVIVSTGAVVNNATTANPFNYQSTNSGNQPLQVGGTSLIGTLAGKALMLQADAAGFVHANTSSSVDGAGGAVVLVTQSTTILSGQVQGPLLSANERVEILMMPTEGWLMWLPQSGSGNLRVWELR